MEGGKPENLEQNPGSTGENQQITQIYQRVMGLNREISAFAVESTTSNTDRCF